ncbi:patatin-like phospholipase family protein [Dankookia rubra]|nr:patatin-like phospholipase family protein [Dankookia rubra]
MDGADRAGAGTRPGRALVLSGGVALGAFEAGAYAALEASGEAPPDLLAGVSAGAVNAAIIAGNPPGARAAPLRRFWDLMATDPTPATTFLLGPPPSSGAWRMAYNEASALQTLLLGHPRMFRPRLVPGPRIGEAPALFDLEPLLARLPDFIDFDRLNGGDGRLILASTDVETGERVVFDTARGTRIGPRHVVASCALLPVFAPVALDGRLLADGGLASNAPLDLVLDVPRGRALDCILIELFARAGSRPRSLGASMARAADLGFGNQTERILEGRAREQRLRALVGRLAARLPAEIRADVAPLLAEACPDPPLTLVRIGYRAARDEAGPGKMFDFSAATLADRWAAGGAAMRQALQRLASPAAAIPLAEGLLLHDVETTPARI